MSKFRIYQVELSSVCNLKCSYCPHPRMQRPQGYMSSDVLDACIAWIRSTGGDRIVLHHFGEPLMHPHFPDRLKQCAESGLQIQFSTNGVLLDKMWNEMLASDAPLDVMLSIHLWYDESPRMYARALHEFIDRAEGTNINILPAYNYKQGEYSIHEWATGRHSKWNVRQCPFIRCNLAVVLWNGDIASCCVDHEGITAQLNIMSDHDKIAQRVTSVWSACETCDVGRIMQDEDF